MIWRGGCHCGNLRTAFETALDPAAMTVRECQCTFCRKHATRAVTDPDGSLTVTVADESLLSRYTFGLETAAYLLCRRCGVYVAAVTTDDPPRAIAIVNALKDREQFIQTPVPSVYDAETREQRVERRRSTWTPVSVSFSECP